MKVTISIDDTWGKIISRTVEINTLITNDGLQEIYDAMKEISLLVMQDMIPNLSGGMSKLKR